MKIEYIQVSQNVPKQEKEAAIDPEEFSKLLTEAASELTNEDDADSSAIESLVGMFNLPFITEDLSQINSPMLNYNSSSTAIELEAPIEVKTPYVGTMDSLVLEEENLEGISKQVKPMIDQEGFMDDLNLFSKDIESGNTAVATNDLKTLKIQTLDAEEVKIVPNKEPEGIDLDLNVIPREDAKVLTEDIAKELSFELEPKENTTKVETKDFKSKGINFLDRHYFSELRTITPEKPEAQTELPEVNLQRVEDSIIELMETTTEGNTNVLKVKLYPEELGTVDVTLRMEEGKLTAKILVDNSQIKDLFTDKLNQLNENLVRQNIHLDKVNVDLNINPSQTGFNLDLSHHGAFNQNRRNFKSGNFAFLNSEGTAANNFETIYHGSSAISILA